MIAEHAIYIWLSLCFLMLLLQLKHTCLSPSFLLFLCFQSSRLGKSRAQGAWKQEQRAPPSLSILKWSMGTCSLTKCLSFNYSKEPCKQGKRKSSSICNSISISTKVSSLLARKNPTSSSSCGYRARTASSNCGRPRWTRPAWWSSWKAALPTRPSRRREAWSTIKRRRPLPRPGQRDPRRESGRTSGGRGRGRGRLRRRRVRRRWRAKGWPILPWSATAGASWTTTSLPSAPSCRLPMSTAYAYSS